MEPDDDGHWLWSWIPVNWFTVFGALFVIGLIRQVLWH